MKFIITILIMGLILLAVLFSQQNADLVTIRFFGWIPPDFKMASYLLILASFFVGIVFAGLVGLAERFRLTMKVSRLRKEIKGLESDLYECRKKILAEGSKSSTPPLSDQNLL